MFRAEEIDHARAWRRERIVLATDRDGRRACVVGRDAHARRGTQWMDLKGSAKI